MTKVFYDHLLILDEVHMEIDVSDLSPEEKREAKKKLDELLHFKIMTRILDLLPKQHHKTFLKRFKEAPYTVEHIEFLSQMTETDITAEIFLHVEGVKRELLGELKKHRKKK